MTLRQPNLDRMLQLGLTGMAEALEEQPNIAGIGQLDFNDRLALLIEREAEHRDRKSYLAHLRQAQLRIPRRCAGCRLLGRARDRPQRGDPAFRRRLDPEGDQPDR